MFCVKVKPVLAALAMVGAGASTGALAESAPEGKGLQAESQSSAHHLRATPETVIWGYMAPDVPPVLRVEPGAIVDIDTFSSVGIPMENQSEFFEKHGMKVDEKLQPLIDIMTKVKKDVGPHILTGPIHIEGAEPGDLLEVRILAVKPREPYFGVNLTVPGMGTLTDLVDKPWMKVIPFNWEDKKARYEDLFDIPLAPFMGTMGVLPTKKVSSVPPGVHGGNLDLKDLTEGSRLFLPVQVSGAGFLTGDGHAAQGDGEVSLTALEVSQDVRVQFILHKECPRPWPLAETEEHYIVMGLDEDLDKAAQIAVQQSVDIIGQFGNMPKEDAYAASSMVVDFALTQIVDGVKGVHGRIPKHLFHKAGKGEWGAPCGDKESTPAAAAGS